MTIYLTPDPQRTLGFSYNPASQIAATTRSNDAYAWTGHYAVNRNYTTNGLNQYTAAGSAGFSYDLNGNLAADGATTFAYDIENRLVSTSDGAALGYDTLGRLFFTYSSATGVTYLASSGDNIGAEFDGGLAIRYRYVHGADGEPLVRYDGSGTSTRRFFHADEHGSIVAVSEGSGAMLAINSYDEHGIPGSANAGRFQYTGQAWLPEIGMYHYRARAYSPSLGRFMQTDPIGYQGGMNLYAYVGNDPVNFADPSGLDPPHIVTGSRLPARQDLGPGLCGGCSGFTGQSAGAFLGLSSGGSGGIIYVPGIPGSVTGTGSTGPNQTVTVTAGTTGHFYFAGGFGGSFASFGPFPHDYWVFNPVATRSQCTQEEAQEGLSRHVVPDQDTSRPVTSTAREYPIYMPGTSLVVGRVSSRMLPNGLGRNTTLFGHPFFFGTIDRGIFAIAQLWVVATHGRGLNFGGIVIAAINEAVGPFAFNREDARLAADLASTCSGGR